MKISIRSGIPADLTQIEALLPRLADFDVPSHRLPEHLWQCDQTMIRNWAGGERPDVDVAVAVVGERIVGLAIISVTKDILSGQPSVHLETLAVDASVEGRGVGSALMNETDTMALKRGAASISLHVFSNNTRARQLYERHGYHGELMRYYKPVG